MQFYPVKWIQREGGTIFWPGYLSYDLSRSDFYSSDDSRFYGPLFMEFNMLRSTVLLLAFSWTMALSSLSMAEETTYRKHIRPLWEKRCAECHGATAPYLGDFAEAKDKYVSEELGPRMDTYADLLVFIAWPDTGAMMRRLDDGQSTADKKPGNMYQHLGEDEEERQKNLKLFKRGSAKMLGI